MAELLPQDRLQPVLLDRLTDHEPDRRQEPPERRVLSMSRLRESVLRDLNWLFNSTTTLTAEQAATWPLVAASVVNYGIPPFSGFCASGLDLRQMEEALRQAVLRYEPRLLPEDIRIAARFDEQRSDQHNVVAFEIECRLWAQPAPLHLLLHSDIDLESGQTTVKEATLG